MFLNDPVEDEVTPDETLAVIDVASEVIEDLPILESVQEKQSTVEINEVEEDEMSPDAGESPQPVVESKEENNSSREEDTTKQSLEVDEEEVEAEVKFSQDVEVEKLQEEDDAIASNQQHLSVEEPFEENSSYLEETEKKLSEPEEEEVNTSSPETEMTELVNEDVEESTEIADQRAENAHENIVQTTGDENAIELIHEESITGEDPERDTIDLASQDTREYEDSLELTDEQVEKAIEEANQMAEELLKDDEVEEETCEEYQSSPKETVSVENKIEPVDEQDNLIPMLEVENQLLDDQLTEEYDYEKEPSPETETIDLASEDIPDYEEKIEMLVDELSENVTQVEEEPLVVDEEPVMQSLTLNEVNEEIQRPVSEERTLIVLGMDTMAAMEDCGKMPPELMPRIDSLHHHSTEIDAFLDQQEEIPSLILEASIPPESHLVVSEAECSAEAVPIEQLELDAAEYESNPVVLSGKMTLSLVGMDLSTEGDHPEPIIQSPDASSTPVPRDPSDPPRAVHFPQPPIDKIFLIPNDNEVEEEEMAFDSDPYPSAIDAQVEEDEELNSSLPYRPPTPPLQPLEREEIAPEESQEFLTYDQLQMLDDLETPYEEESDPQMQLNNNIEETTQQPQLIEDPNETMCESDTAEDDQVIESNQILQEIPEFSKNVAELVLAESMADYVLEDCDDRVVMETVDEEPEDTQEQQESIPQSVVRNGVIEESTNNQEETEEIADEEAEYEKEFEVEEMEHSLEQVECEPSCGSIQLGIVEPKISEIVIREDFSEEEEPAKASSSSAGPNLMTEEEILQARQEIEEIKKLLADVSSGVIQQQSEVLTNLEHVRIYSPHSARQLSI